MKGMASGKVQQKVQPGVLKPGPDAGLFIRLTVLTIRYHNLLQP
jgi:hypothetical protein